jgi:hypothetical protein
VAEGVERVIMIRYRNVDRPKESKWSTRERRDTARQYGERKKNVGISIAIHVYYELLETGLLFLLNITA